MNRLLAFLMLTAGTGVAATISGRILDAATGQVIAATVSIRTSSGEIISDHPSFKSGFRCAGAFEKEIEPGETEITVTRGFDYLPVSRRITAREGEHRTLTFDLRRRSPLRGEGWYASDHHAHMIHGERSTLVDFPYVALAGRSEGLDFLSVAQAWNLPEPTPENLERATRAVSTPDFFLSWNLEAPKNYFRGDAGQCLGHGWTVGMRGRTRDGRDAVAELLEINAHDYESDKPSFANFESHALIHSLGGFVSYTHPVRWWTGTWGGKGIYPVEEQKFISNMATELPFDTIAGPTYDSIDILMPPQERAANAAALQLWFLLLNHGYHVLASASSDATFDNPGRGIVGAVRMYTRVDGAPDLAKLTAAMKARQSFVTSGPLLTLEVGGLGSGHVLEPAARARKTRIRAWADRLSRVELVRNGSIVRKFDVPAESDEFSVELDLKETERAWYIARCYGSDESQVAITNPVWFEPAGWQAPTSTPARVTAVVLDSRTGEALDGKVEIVHMVGKEPVIESETGLHGGTASFSAPGTSRVSVRVPGYKPAMQSIFLDYAPLREMATNMRPTQLTDWGTFERVQESLQHVVLEFRMVPQ